MGVVMAGVSGRKMNELIRPYICVEVGALAPCTWCLCSYRNQGHSALFPGQGPNIWEFPEIFSVYLKI